MEVHKAELFYTDPNTKQNKSIIAEGKDEGDAGNRTQLSVLKPFFLTYLLLVLLELIR